MFEKAKWIRAKTRPMENEYQDFVCFFEAPLGGEATLRISSETDYVARLNGKVVAFGQFPDLRSRKIFDEIAVGAFIEAGKNKLEITAYFEHTETAGYTEKGLGLLFEIEADGKTICVSDGDTLSRPNLCYKSGSDVPLITGQLGYSYQYDFAREGESFGFESSQILSRTVKLYPRPIRRLVESKNRSAAFRTGGFSFCGGETSAEKMQRAEIFDREFSASFPDGSGIKIENERNLYLLADLGEEKCGLLTFDIEVEEACDMCVAYGEHIADGRIRSYILGRNFAFDFRLKKGRNRFTGYFRRLGARYLSLFLDSPTAVVYDFNLLSVGYPVTKIERKFDDSRLQKIYDVSVNTLKLCMHEHYEDTPWREQALYAMDGRTQMLCGYFAFGETSFARASLELLSENLREDGFFTLTAPRSTARDCLTIPCFSLVQFCALEEYVRFSGDVSLFERYEENYQTVLNNLLSRIETEGLLKAVKGEYYWNFYEWTEGLDGNFLTLPEDRYEAPLNAFMILALKSYRYLSGRIGRNTDEYERALYTLTDNLEKFYDAEKGCYASFMENDGTLSHYSELTNSLVLLASNSPHRERIAELLSKPSFLSPVAINNHFFKYKALLGCGDEKINARIVGDIQNRWGKMLEQGATTFFEDEQGEAAFNGAGSLSHGWSAIPVYVLCKLREGEEENGL